MKKIIAQLSTIISTAVILLVSTPVYASISSTISIDNFSNGGTIKASTGYSCATSHCDYSWSRADGTGITFTVSSIKSGMKLKKFDGTRGSDGSSICAESNPTSAKKCTISNADNLSQVSADYVYSNYKLAVTEQGSGSGYFTVTKGSSCGTNCFTGYDYNDQFSITAHPDPGSVFTGWETSGQQCYAYSGVGKASTAIRNTNATCSVTIRSSTQTNTAVGTFSKSTTSSSGSSSSTTSNSSSTSTSSETTTDGKPKIPTVDTIQVDGNEVSSKDSIILNSNQPLQLAGKTVPNGIVTLTIHSDPMTVTTKADKNGNWSYTISGLPAGDHYVEASVKDPKTKKTSKLGKLLSFTVAQTDNPASTAVNAGNNVASSSKKSVFIAIIVLLALAAAGWYFYGRKWWQKRKMNKTGPIAG